MVRYACTSKLNRMHTEWLALITVSLSPPKLAAFIQISQEEKPPAHVITPPMPRCPTEEWQMAWAKTVIETVLPLCIVLACSLLPWSSQKQVLQPPAQLRQPHCLGTTPSSKRMLGTLRAGHGTAVSPWGISPAASVLWYFLSCLHQNVVDLCCQLPGGGLRRDGAAASAVSQQTGVGKPCQGESSPFWDLSMLKPHLSCPSA